ncbi:MAG: hypothetical protein QNJ42_01760 [Crocosphaera sp.]|nr:hypothetical protein [Crocosphaera sp.]
MITTSTVENTAETLKNSKTLNQGKTTLVSDGIESQIDELLTKIAHLISNPQIELTDETQEEIAYISIIVQKVKKLSSSHNFLNNDQNQSELKGLLSNLQLAIQSVQSSNRKTLAKKLRMNAEFTIRKLENRVTAGLINFWENFRLQSSVSFKLLLGLFLAFPLYIGVPVAVYSSASVAEKHLEEKGIVVDDISARTNDLPDIYKKDYEMMITLAILCFVGGSTGSIISILSRLSKYREVQDEKQLQESLTPILVGLCKPMIGGTFGLLIYALLAGGILPLQFRYTNDEKRQDLRWLSFYSVAFVVGFSERLAKDIITNTENQFKPQSSDNVNPLVSTKSPEENYGELLSLNQQSAKDSVTNIDNQFQPKNLDNFNSLEPTEGKTEEDDYQF